MIGGFMFELITGRIPYFWVGSEFILRVRLDAQVTGSCESAYEEAVRLNIFKPVLTDDLDSGMRIILVCNLSCLPVS